MSLSPKAEQGFISEVKGVWRAMENHRDWGLEPQYNVRGQIIHLASLKVNPEDRTPNIQRAWGRLEIVADYFDVQLPGLNRPAVNTEDAPPAPETEETLWIRRLDAESFVEGRDGGRAMNIPVARVQTKEYSVPITQRKPDPIEMWSVVAQEDGTLAVCDHRHARNEACEWKVYVPEDDVARRVQEATVRTAEATPEIRTRWAPNQEYRDARRDHDLAEAREAFAINEKIEYSVMLSGGGWGPWTTWGRSLVGVPNFDHPQVRWRVKSNV